MIITASFFVIGAGILCLYNKDLAWMLYEFDARMWGADAPRKGKNWQQQVQMAGYCLVWLGILGMMTGINLILQ